MLAASGQPEIPVKSKEPGMWDGRFFSFTVCPSASPELYNELVELSPRARAERLRFLAGLGYYASKGALTSSAQPQVEVKGSQALITEQQPSKEKQKRRMSSLDVLGTLSERDCSPP